mmetsp:Transcript_19662/g.40542  ORF Transcript_19662/g.40542 Transcript_19662/m.40542 type:complete len:290 (+) Transcript_19662:849-1718(+)
MPVPKTKKTNPPEPGGPEGSWLSAPWWSSPWYRWPAGSFWRSWGAPGQSGVAPSCWDCAREVPAVRAGRFVRSRQEWLACCACCASSWWRVRAGSSNKDDRRALPRNTARTHGCGCWRRRNGRRSEEASTPSSSWHRSSPETRSSFCIPPGDHLLPRCGAGSAGVVTANAAGSRAAARQAATSTPAAAPAPGTPPIAGKRPVRRPRCPCPRASPHRSAAPGKCRTTTTTTTIGAEAPNSWHPVRDRSVGIDGSVAELHRQRMIDGCFVSTGASREPIETAAATHTPLFC